MCDRCNDPKAKHVRAVPSRRDALAAGVALVAAPFLRGISGTVQAAAGKVQEWLSYGGDKAGTKYSPLAQIGSENFNRLRVAWTWSSSRCGFPDVLSARRAAEAVAT